MAYVSKHDAEQCRLAVRCHTFDQRTQTIGQSGGQLDAPATPPPSRPARFAATGSACYSA